MANDQNKNNLQDRLSSKEKDSDSSQILELEKKVKLVLQYNDFLILNIEKVNVNIEKASKLEIVRKNKIKKLIDSETSIIKSRIDELLPELKKDREEKTSKIHKVFSTIGNTIDGISENTNKLLDFVNDINIENVMSVVTKLSKITVRGVGWFLDKTVGKVIKFFGFRGNILSTLLNKTLTTVYSGIKWVYDVAKNTLTKVWDTFVWLAKIGWNVISTIWEIVSTPVKQIYSIFKDIFVAIISSPLGFLGMAIGFTFLMRYAIKTLWPKVKIFLGDVIQGVWDWTVKLVADIFYGGNQKQLIQDFNSIKDKIFDWLKSVGKWFISKYDDYIAPFLNFPKSETIKKYLFGDNNIFKQGWNYLVDITSSLFNDNILDEVQMTWNFMKDLVYRARYFFGSETNEPEVILYQDAVREENEKRLELFYTDAVNSYAKAKLQSELLNTVLENSNKDDKILSELLNKSGSEIISNIKRSKFVSDSSLNSKIIDHIDDSMFSGMIKNMITEKMAISKESVAGASKASKFALMQLSNLSSVSSTTDLTAQQEALTAYSQLTIDDFAKSNETILSKKDIEISANISDLTKSVENNNLIIESNIKNGMVSIEKTAKIINKKYSDDLQIITDMYGKSEKELGKILDTTFNRDRILHKIYENNAQLTKREAERMADMLLDSLYDVSSANAKFQKKADGGIVKEPTTIIVGEGNYPELIVPLNMMGLDFIKESMESVINYAKKEEENLGSVEQQKKRSMVRSIKHNLPTQDVKMYDMKNIASGYVIIG